MAKEKRAFEDLDAELAALEAELAALEGKKPAAKPKKAEKPKEAPAPSHAPPEAPSAPAEEKKGRFKLPGLSREKDSTNEEVAAKPRLALPFGKKKAEPASDAPAVAASRAAASMAPDEPMVSPTPAQLAVAPALARSYDPALWRREGAAWVRNVPDHEPRYMRRVLDENGAVVREEPATKADADEVAGVKAERGIGRLFGRKRS